MAERVRSRRHIRDVAALIEDLEDNVEAECSLMNNFVPAKDLKKIRDAMKSNTACRFLKMSMNSIQGNSVTEIFSDILRFGNSSLLRLDLESNLLQDEGAGNIAKALRYNNTLTHLNLSSNGIGDKGASVLASSLKTNTSLTHLQLWRNRISDVGAVNIAEMVKVNKAITHLILWKNNIADEGAKGLALALMSNTSLHRLDLHANKISADGVAAFIDGLENNFTLMYLTLTENVFTVGNQLSITSTIKNLLDRNKNLAENAYRNVLKGNGSGRWSRSKLMVIGQAKAGKTATVRSLLSLPFNPEWNSTEGIEINITQAETAATVLKWKKLEEHRTSNFISEFCTQLAAVAYYDEAERQTAPVSKKEKNNQPDEDQVKKRTMGVDVKEVPVRDSREIDIRETGTVLPEKVQEDLLMKFDELLFLNSRGKNGVSFTIWDYGGQEVFYTLHHLFLTSYGVYLLVFDMQQLAKEDCENAQKYILFWLNSVSLHAPDAPILIVGTMMDQLKKRRDIYNVNEKLMEVIGSGRYSQIVDNTSEEKQLMFFPLSNISGRGIDNIRKSLENAVKDKDYVNQSIPLKWLYFLHLLQKSPDLKRIFLSDAYLIGRKAGITRTEEVNDCLELFHNLGLIVYLTATQNLRNVVALDPQWLASALGRVIRDVKVHNVDEERLKESGLSEEYKALYTSGVATIDLLEYLWGGDLSDETDYLLDLMLTTLLASRWNFNGSSKILIPCLISSVRSRKSVKPRSKGAKSVFMFDFSDSFLPIGIFERLVCICVAYSSRQDGSREPELSKTESRIWFGSHMMFLEQQDNSIFVSIQPQECANLCLEILRSMMRKLKTDIMGENFKWREMLQIEGEFISYEEAKSRETWPWFTDSNLSDKLPSAINLENFLR